MFLGTTYSHRHISWLGLDSHKAFTELLDFRFDVIRLVCYWHEIEKEKGVFDFSAIERLLEVCDKKGQKVLLTVGMKAPRWPEFRIPGWTEYKTVSDLEQYTLEFLFQSIIRLKKCSCIDYWQVENEPLDPSGPNDHFISPNFLEKETALTRKLDKRPIVITLWGNDITRRKLFNVVESLADIIGLDRYYQIPRGNGVYKEPRDSDEAVKRLIETSEKPIWITELQAEPWRWHDASQDALNIDENYNRVKLLNPQAIFFWGYEYWYMKKAKGDKKMWSIIRGLVH